jgi:tRNA A-37 threonylcarbamoyl transferase component Bud32
MSFNIGENVGQYRIIEQLGQGGMATVYKAYHASLDRYVALKVLHPAFNEDQTFISRFQREARVVAKLEHPNIVPIYDYSEHEKRPYLVMKYIEGDTLKARLTQGPLTSEEIEQVVNSVGAALEYAHRQGILHRDIKPSNVMIAADGMMYLADFGLARIAQAGESTMSSDSIMGTPQYISPEQAMGKKDLDAGTDIYSFGVMLYELVVGQVPFSADTPFSVIHDHIYTPLPMPKKVNPNVPDTVQRVLLKALAKDRLDRYATVEELMDAFKQAWTEAGVPMQGTAIIMRSTAAKDRTGSKKQAIPAAGVVLPPVKKRSSWMWVSIGLVILLCLAVIGLAVRNRLTRTTEPISESPTPPVVQPTLGEPLPEPDNGVTSPEAQQPLPSPQDASPELSVAMELVAKNPNDPDARLNLALALWDSREVRRAVDELNQAITLAGPENKDFLQKAAEKFVERQAWAPAAGLYIRLAANNRGQNLPREQVDRIHETVYKAAEQKELLPVGFFERVDVYNPALGHVTRGRQALYQGNLEKAKAEMGEAEKMIPDMPEIQLLKAEMEMKIGNAGEAKTTLLALTSDQEIPKWVRLMAEDYLKIIQ